MIRVLFVLTLMGVSTLCQAQIALRMEAVSSGVLFSSPGYMIAGMDLSDATEAFSFQWALSRAPVDPGTTIGPLQAGDFSVVVALTDGTPLLAQAIANAESLSGTLLFFGPDATEQTVLLYRIDFQGGRLMGVRPFATGTPRLTYAEELQISFDLATLTHVPTGRESTINGQ